MIRIREKHMLLELTPAPGFGQQLKTRKYDLVHGATCPVCNNVMLAQVVSEQPLPDLWGYEETNKMKTSYMINGILEKTEIQTILPEYTKHLTTRDETQLCYENKSFKSEGKYYTTLRLTNHVYPGSLLKNSRDKREEPGTKVCVYGGFMSYNREMAIKLALVGAGVHSCNTLDTIKVDLKDLDLVDKALNSAKQSTKPGGKHYFYSLQGLGDIPTYYIMFDIAVMKKMFTWNQIEGLPKVA
jgi:hypothetical protein